MLAGFRKCYVVNQRAAKTGIACYGSRLSFRGEFISPGSVRIIHRAGLS